jgi:hypothetical protein
VASGDTFLIQQYIEGLNCADLGWGTANAQTVTLSFWVRSSLTGTFGGALTNSAANRSYPFSYTISAANTWEQKSVTIAGDTTGTWLTTNGIGISLRFGLGSGSTLSGTAGAWAAGNFIQPTGSQSVVGTNGATFYITGVQLEVGTQATSFEYRQYQQELALCQRYYVKLLSNGTSNTGNLLVGVVESATSARAMTTLPTTMRSFPTVSFGGSLRVYDGTVAPTLTSIGTISTTTILAATITASGGGLTVGRCAILINPAAGTGTDHIDASAEL